MTVIGAIRVYAKKHLRFQFALSNLRFQNYKKRVCEAFAVSFMLFHLNFKLSLTSIMVNFKKPARKLSLRKRFLALSSNEAVYVRSLDKRLLKLMTGLKQLRFNDLSHGMLTRWDKTINQVYYSTVNVVNARLKYDYSYSSMI